MKGYTYSRRRKATTSRGGGNAGIMNEFCCVLAPLAANNHNRPIIRLPGCLARLSNSEHAGRVRFRMAAIERKARGF